MDMVLEKTRAPRFARVIVDVPTMQTDHPYDYYIPDRYQDLIQVGMRVQVPFGVRQVLAYVVELTATSEFEGELKEITSLLDDQAVLTPEMLSLGRDMAEHLFSYVVTCYQTMLPRLLKVDYHKYFVPSETLTYQHRKSYFKDQEEVSWEAAEEAEQLKNLLVLKETGEVSVDYRVADRKHYKTEKWIQPLLDAEQLEQERDQLRKTAKKQILLCEVLMELEGRRVSVKWLRENYDLSLQTIRRGQDFGWLKLFEVEVDRDPYADRYQERTQDKPLTDDQSQVYQEVKQAISDQVNDTYLLQGVTGSGKTEVYLQLIRQALDQGQTAILLVPEIALTPQMVAQLKGRFGDLVAVLHSQLSVGEHFDEWRKMRRGDARVVVGARSSIFAPIDNIGIIIIDEEHETTYKQEEAPRYHARDVAKWRASYHSCPLVLGSATPALESRARAQNGVYHLLSLPGRINGKALPAVDLIDMREEFKHKNYYQFSRSLKEAIDQTLSQGQQVALMLNRRGYANYVMCRDCGYVFQCQNCDVSLTYHYSDRSLQCHYCGYSRPYPQVCPLCQGQHLRPFGSGTEKVEEEIYQLFPGKNLVRMDNDTTRKKGAHERLLAKVASGEADILLGTQMIAKGLDFPNITLVGVINADTSLYLPDFRASERTFQLLTQVSGRAGRGDLEGRVMIQTFNPDHYALQLAKHHDYDRFYQKEMTYRKLNHYSPYFYTIRLSISHFNEKDALKAALTLATLLRERSQGSKDYVIGPSQNAISRIKNRYYYQILYQYRNQAHIQPLFQEIRDLAQDWSKKKLYVSIDVEPLSFL